MKGYTKHRFHQSLKQMYLSKKNKTKNSKYKNQNEKKKILLILTERIITW